MILLVVLRRVPSGECLGGFFEKVLWILQVVLVVTKEVLVVL